jgi:hypothetical protein
VPRRPRKQAPQPPREKRAEPAASSLVVQFIRDEDPTTEQTAVVHDLVKRFALRARVAREMPGALRIEVRPDSEDEFRREVAALLDWDVATEGTAEMPSKPLREEFEG